MRPISFYYNIVFLVTFLCLCQKSSGQLSVDSAWQHAKKNVVRYNISSGLLFGFDKCVILGYERVIKPGQSISMNIGTSALPKLVSIITDSFQLQSDIKNKGINFSVDYRFYLQKENKYIAPRGVYIGPYYSYNKFDRENKWNLVKPGSTDVINTTAKFEIHTVGAELGYQFIFWKKMALDFVLVGPGISSYKLSAKIDGTLDPDEREQLQSAVQQLVQQKFPGMNFVFADKAIDASGVLNTTSIGFRYLIHVGFNF
jgi:hypothetical protein